MKKIILTVIFSILLLAPVFVLAAPNINQAGTYLGNIGGKTGLSSDFESTTGLVINTVLALIGTVFFILTVYAGIRWMTAQGNEEKVTKAKDTLEAALIGIAIVFLAYAITAFVTGRLVSEQVSGGGKCILPGGDCLDVVNDGIAQQDCTDGGGQWTAGVAC